MLVTRTRSEVREWTAARREAGARVALVPTMGALHEGHLSLVRLAAATGASVALSIFVNPLQFGPGEDLDRYPRDLDRDLDLARAEGVDLVFAPSVREMYPAGEPAVRVTPVRGQDVLCGRSRPGHFEGVLTVVARLFGLFKPDLAAFGRKDYQQLALIRRMVVDLEMGIEILEGPTVREPDGLAMSSRNRYLSADERQSATALVRALAECERLFVAGETDAEVFRARMNAIGDRAVPVEYAEVVDPVTLERVDHVGLGSVCAIAAHVGATRLIDNHVVGSGSPLSGTS